MSINPLSVASEGYLNAGTGDTIAIASSGYIDIFGDVVTPPPAGGGDSSYWSRSKELDQYDLYRELVDTEDAEIIAIITAFINMTAAGRKFPWDH